MQDTDKYTPGPAEVCYMRLQWRRQPYLDRAREMSKLTIPTVFPPDGDNSSNSLEDPSQSAGSRGVNNLSSKLLLALIPPNLPFFRLEIDPALAQKLAEFSKNLQPGQEDPKTELEKTLARYEFQVYGESERIVIRPCMFQVLRHLIIGGNCLTLTPNKGTMRYFPLSSYVVRRDPTGNALEIYVHEKVSPQTLPPEIREQVKDLCKTDPTAKHYDDTVDLYTGVVREDDKWRVWQEACGIKLSSGDGTYKLDDCHWNALRFSRIDGEDYGRGMVEDYAGDLKQLEVLSDALAQGSLAAAKVLFMVSPNAQVTKKELANTPNCGFIDANEDDVHCLQVNKQGDFSIAKNMIDTLRGDLGFIFLLNSAVQRNGERVTAEEIRYVAQELENSLGGVYSLLGEEFQRPLIKRLIARLEKTKALPKLSEDMVRPVIVTGLDALGRGHEIARIERALQILVEFYGPQAATQFTRPEKMAAKVFAAHGIVDEDIVRSTQEINQMQQQAQQQAMAQTMAPNIAKAGGDLVNNALTQPQPTNGAPQ